MSLFTKKKIASIAPEKSVKVGVIGLGGRGLSLLKNELLPQPELDVVAVCDIYEDRTEAGAKAVKNKNGNDPFKTNDYKNILKMKEVDLIFVSAAWECHIEIAIASMEAGKFVALEVGGAYSIEECFALVDCYERTKVPVMLLENCCYGKYELMILNMVRKGLFGEIVHCSGGYLHDLRHEISFGKENRHYRLNNYINRDCENYPTHELGPIAKVLNINRGNVMVKLSSFSSKARGLHEYIVKKKSDDNQLLNTTFKQGDIVTTVIQTENKETIVLTLDTTLPRAYSRGFTVRGTKMMYNEDTDTLFVDGTHNKFDFIPKKIWGNGKKYLKKYMHPIWKQNLKLNKGGHGGMDTMVVRAMIESFVNKTTPPIDVYDTASWMAVTALSELSINNGGAPVDFPDFTRGKWKNRQDIPRGVYGLED